VKASVPAQHEHAECALLPPAAPAAMRWVAMPPPQVPSSQHLARCFFKLHAAYNEPSALPCLALPLPADAAVCHVLQAAGLPFEEDCGVCQEPGVHRPHGGCWVGAW
jgi:hypothetical protein